MTEHADTIIVGAGSAGCVIAARMTEKSTKEVLLLEAGPDYPDASALPADLRNGGANSYTAHDWGLRHRPTTGQMLFNFPRGRVVGGSSAVNTCIALRGSPEDYEEWAQLAGPDWSWTRCLAAFKRLERDLDKRNEWHGNHGPIPIRRHTPAELSPWQQAFLEACKELGFARCDDTNDPTQTGYGPHAMNKVDGERQSAARCYLTAHVRARPNLRIQPETLVRRVLIRNGRAWGVEVERRGEVETLTARRVVLSAGAVLTPGILLRSGVGPRGVVERLGVHCASDVSAVGARLLDHPGVAQFFLPKGSIDTRNPVIQTVLRYTSPHSHVPNDLQIQPGSVVLLPWVPLPLCSIMAPLGKPRGHGRLEFESADARAKPRIYSHLLEHPEDRARAAEVMELGWLLGTTKPMRELATPLWPGEKVLAYRDRREAWVPRACDSGYHPCGTAPMGFEGAPDAATDPRGRVRGVEGLFVADASLMPTIPSANTNLATLMIGERFGEWLRDDVL